MSIDETFGQIVVHCADAPSAYVDKSSYVQKPGRPSRLLGEVAYEFTKRMFDQSTWYGPFCKVPLNLPSLSMAGTTAYSEDMPLTSSGSPPVRMLSMDALRFQEVLSNGTSPPFWSITSYA